MEILSRFYSEKSLDSLGRVSLDFTGKTSLVSTSRTLLDTIVSVSLQISVTNVESSISISPDQLWFQNLQKSHQNSEDSRFLQGASPGKFPSLWSLGYIKDLLNTYLHYPLINLHSIPATIISWLRSFRYTQYLYILLHTPPPYRFLPHTHHLHDMTPQKPTQPEEYPQGPPREHLH